MDSNTVQVPFLLAMLNCEKEEESESKRKGKDCNFNTKILFFCFPFPYPSHFLVPYYRLKLKVKFGLLL